MGKWTASYVHKDESCVNHVEGLVLKWQRLANVQLHKC